MTRSRESRVEGERGVGGGEWSGGRGGNSRGGVWKEGYGGKETAKVRQLRERGVGGGAKFIIALHFILP